MFAGGMRGPKQASVALQLKIALFRFGHCGNASCTLNSTSSGHGLSVHLTGEAYTYVCVIGWTSVPPFSEQPHRCHLNTPEPLLLRFSSVQCFLDGFSAAVASVANLFGVSSGAVSQCTCRVVTVIQRLSHCYLRWPNARRRGALGRYAEGALGFRSCIGSVDGTSVPLSYAPVEKPWTYFDSHDRYSLSLLLVSDHHRNILAVTTGFTGAASDTLVQRHAAWHRRPDRYFSPDE